MRRLFLLFTMVVAVFAFVVSVPVQASAQERVDERAPAAALSEDAADMRNTVQSSTAVLRDILPSIPQNVLENAAGIAVIPNIVKAGLVVGGRHGTGVLVNHEGNNWSLPVSISMTGGSIGFQAGITSSDLVLVFQNADSMNELIGGDLTLGADAVVVAGPVGGAGKVQAGMGDVLSYQRTDGLFAGVALTGGVLSLNNDDTRDFYNLVPGGGMAYYESARDILAMDETKQMTRVPPSAEELQRVLRLHSASEVRQ